MDIQEIIDRNYKATVRRGKIIKFTTADEFVEKIYDETRELFLSTKIDNSFDSKELADVVLVCFAMAKHFDVDLLKAMEEKIIYNENRED